MLTIFLELMKNKHQQFAAEHVNNLWQQLSFYKTNSNQNSL